MSSPKLLLDADTSRKALQRALQERGHDVTRTPNPWMALNASDQTQLLGAAAQGRIIFTFNIPDFMRLALQYPQHGGIVLAAQTSWTLSALIAALDTMLTETSASDWPGPMRWLNQWRST